MRISDWSSDVCSSDLVVDGGSGKALPVEEASGGIDQPASTKCPILGSGGGFGKFAPMATCVAFTRRYLLFLHRTALPVGPLPVKAHRPCGSLRSFPQPAERRYGHEGVSLCRSAWSPYH